MASQRGLHLTTMMMMMMMMRVFLVEIPSVPVERYQHLGAKCYLQIHSLFYFEGKGSGFLRNTDTILYKGTQPPPPPIKKTQSACTLPRETKTHTQLNCTYTD